MEKAVLESFHSIKSRIYCILQLGYFKARSMFFVFTVQDVEEDAVYIQEQYFPDVPFAVFEITKVTRLNQQRLILDLFNYRVCKIEERQQLATKAAQAALVCGKPIYVFRELIHYLSEQRIVMPGYSFMQDTVGQALTYEQNRLITLIRHHLAPSEIEALTQLLDDAHLDTLEHRLEERLTEVNRRIASGDNEHFRIKGNGPQLRWILLSLALKTTTQSIIVGKLSAFARKNKTRRALWEYDNILQSLYLLEYIDSPPLRRNVQQALNRGESYHQLRRAVSYANFGKLRFKTEYEQQLWGECARLIANGIIYYNATILSHLREHRERTQDDQGAALLKQVSPVAWQHINFYGRYEFNQALEAIDMKAIIQELAHVSIDHEKTL